MTGSIYTRTGDRGETSLVGGGRVPKDAARVEAYGTVDETNAWIGAARAFVGDRALEEALEFLQHRLFNCSSNLATPAATKRVPPRIEEADIAFLERAIDRFEGATGKLTAFVLPGGSRAAAFLHVARTVCRRAERRVVGLGADEPVDPLVLAFLNRASDFLFAAARYSNHLEGRPDAAWDKGAAIPPM
ncbi:MAG: cob(I)yrinic acid a,c-diamide adenosyltransferase [Planctomycetes bacterium]|nr:cob(I)yrinic acid a,c-diamide adenosyltransferase [Planctomycetota bacterium]